MRGDRQGRRPGATGAGAQADRARAAAARAVRGWQDDVRSHVAARDRRKLPQRAVLPPTAIEAAGMGLLLVSSAAGGVPTLVEDGRTGLLVPPGESVAHWPCVWRLVTERRALQAGRGGGAEVRRRFSAERGLRRCWPHHGACWRRPDGFMVWRRFSLPPPRRTPVQPPEGDRVVGELHRHAGRCGSPQRTRKVARHLLRRGRSPEAADAGACVRSAHGTPPWHDRSQRFAPAGRRCRVVRRALEGIGAERVAVAKPTRPPCPTWRGCRWTGWGYRAWTTTPAPGRGRRHDRAP